MRTEIFENNNLINQIEMIKTRIHIKTTNEFMDDSLFILTELPFVPRVGDRIQLSQDMLNELEQKVKGTVLDSMWQKKIYKCMDNI